MSSLEFHRSIEAVKKKAKGNIWLLGDLNLPKLTWPENIPTLKPDCSLKHDENSTCDSKKLFSFLKSSKQPQLGTPALNHRDRLATEIAEKADLHNLQFQSVFTTKAPLSLSRLCKMKLYFLM